MAKHTNRHGLIWEKVDRIQTAPDMRKAERIVKTSDNVERELRNAFRL